MSNVISVISLFLTNHQALAQMVIFPMLLSLIAYAMKKLSSNSKLQWIGNLIHAWFPDPESIVDLIKQLFGQPLTISLQPSTPSITAASNPVQLVGQAIQGLSQDNPVHVQVKALLDQAVNDLQASK